MGFYPFIVIIGEKLYMISLGMYLYIYSKVDNLSGGFISVCNTF